MIATIFTLLPLFLGLAWLCRYLPLTGRQITSPEVVDHINQLLPQTQCRKCGFDGCLPYARAVASGSTDIHLCEPGGISTERHLAELLGRDPEGLRVHTGKTTQAQVASIEEASCIGCVKCIAACPVDAILGSAGQIHAVVPELCTGCELCLPPCPMDCIHLRPAGNIVRHWGWTKPARMP